MRYPTKSWQRLVMPVPQRDLCAERQTAALITALVECLTVKVLPYYALVRLSSSSKRMLRVCSEATSLTVPSPTAAKLKVQSATG